MATNSDTDETTLYVRFGEGDDEGLMETLEAVDRGEVPDPHFEVVYHDPDDVHRLTRPKNMELLRAIVQHRPDSIRETARLVGRDVSQVHRNLGELEDLHVIELEEAGQSKRPTVWYDRIDIDLDLDSPTVAPANAEA